MVGLATSGGGGWVKLVVAVCGYEGLVFGGLVEMKWRDWWFWWRYGLVVLMGWTAGVNGCYGGAGLGGVHGGVGVDYRGDWG